MSVQKSVRTLLIENYESEKNLSDENKRIIDNIPPQLLSSGTHNKLQKSIDKYKFINEIFQNNREIINQIINYYINNIYEYCLSHKSSGLINFDYCIGGSVIWNKLFKNYYDIPNLMSEYEKSAIHDTTVDLYYYITVDNDINYINVINQLYEKINEIINYMNEKEETIISKNLNNIKINRLDFTNSTVFKIFIELNLINCELLNINLYKINKTDINDDEEDNGSSDGNEDQKIINLGDIKDENNYLNIFGLYIYNYISKSNRKPIKNDYDVYKVRDQIFDKYILVEQKLDIIEYEFIYNYKLKILYYIIHYYQQTFSKCKKYYDKYFIKNLKKKIFDETENLKVFDNILRYYLIEQFRPYINNIIILINNDLRREGLPTLFAVGGDSCRRYKNDLSKTEDIDTKLYLSDMTQFPRAEEIIVLRLNQLVSWLILNKDNVINRTKLLEYLSIKGYDEYCVRIDRNGNLTFSYYDIHMKIKHNLFYNLSDTSSTFFRFRHVFSSIFPVDLYSSDFQIKNNYKIYKVDDSYDNERIIYEDNELTFDIAYLDISVDIIKDNPNYIHLIKNDILSNKIPTARLLFLITDLINTYNNDESSIMRLINGKNKKDYRRYIDLVKIFKSSLFTEQQEGNNLKLNETNFELFNFHNDKDKYLVLQSQAENKVARYKLDINPNEEEDINNDFISNPIIIAYTNFFVKDYKQKRTKNKEKIVFNFNLINLNKNTINKSRSRRGGFASISNKKPDFHSLITIKPKSKSKKSMKLSEKKNKEISFYKLKKIAEKEKDNDSIDNKYYNNLRKTSTEYHKLNKIINTTINNKMKLKILKYLKKLLSF